MGRQQLFAVEQEGVEDFVLEKYKENQPATKISELLMEQKQVKISPLSINRWLNKQRKSDVNTKHIVSKEKFDTMAINYSNELKTILEEVKEMKAIAKARGELDNYTKLVGKIYDGINLFAKIHGDIKQGGGSNNVDINIIIEKINETASENSQRLRNSFNKHKTFTVDAEIIGEDVD